MLAGALLFATGCATGTWKPRRTYMTQKAPENMPVWRRPIRMPKDVKMTHTVPPFAFTSQKSTWYLPFIVSRDVPENWTLKFQLYGGRNNKGKFGPAQTESPAEYGYISAQLEDGTKLSMKPDKMAGVYELSMPKGGLKKDDILTVILGDNSEGCKGITAHHYRLLDKFFALYCIPDKEDEPKFPEWAGETAWGKGNSRRTIGLCTMHLLGNKIDHLRAYIPSSTKPGVPFDILVRPEDSYSTLSHERPGEIVVLLDDEEVEAKVEKVHDSTCLTASVTLPEKGVYRFTVIDKSSGMEVVSNPTICSDNGQPRYWGMIHGHTEMSDGTGSLEWYFHQLKNEVMLDFAAPGDHDHLWETPDDYWAITCEAVKRWNDPGEFVTLLGYEWAKWRKNGDADRNVYYLENDRSMYRSDDGEFPSPPELFKALDENNEKAIVIPHHTGHGGNFCDWKDHDEKFERLVEIYQVRGSYECSPEDGNPVPERPSKVEPFEKGYVRNALATGWRIGFTAGGDDHNGQWGTEFRSGDPESGYKQGLMCVEADEKTRDSVFAGMYDRRVVATTGSRMILAYDLNGTPMGSELSLKDNPEMASSRKLSVQFHGTAPVDRIDIIRNNKVVHSVPGNGELDMNVTWEDTEPAEGIWMPTAKYCDHPFTFYYVRVVQTDNEVAWASPIWIDP